MIKIKISFSDILFLLFLFWLFSVYNIYTEPKKRDVGIRQPTVFDNKNYVIKN